MAGSIDTSVSGGNIETHNNGGGIFTYGGGGVISTSTGGGGISTTNGGGSITTSNGGGSIDTTGSGTIQFGVAANRITLVGTAASNGKTATLPNVTGTVAVGAHSATTTHAMFSAGAAGYTTRAIASADIATALTTPGPIGTTPNTGAFTTLSGTSTLTLGVVSATAGTIVLRNATNAYTTTIVPSVVTASRQLNLPLITGTDTVAVLGLAQTFSGNKTFSGTVSCQSTLGVSGATTCSSTLAVTGSTTLTGLLTLGGGDNLLATASLTTYNGSNSDINLGSNQPSINSPSSPDWIRITVSGTHYYMPIWNAAPPA
jgi:hypothetical protein